MANNITNENKQKNSVFISGFLTETLQGPAAYSNLFKQITLQTPKSVCAVCLDILTFFVGWMGGRKVSR